MLRAHVVRLSSRHLVARSTRSYAAAKKGDSSAKRALNQEQLKGESAKKAAAAPPPATGTSKATAPPTVAPKVETPSPNGGAGGGDPSGGGGGFMLPVVVVATGLGAAWYFDMIPGMSRAEEPVVKKPVKKSFEKPKPVVKTVPKKETMTKKEPERTVDATPDPEPVVEAVKQVVEAVKEEVAAPVKATAPVEEEEVQPESMKAKEAAPREVAPEPEPTPAPEPEPIRASALDAAHELTASRQDESSATLQKAHQALRANVDESLYTDLENLSPAELRVRVVQLGTEMTERTKWEAMRLKEFLAMKEKEVGEKYLELMQKQRLEFEEMMARKLRDQEDVLARQSNAALQQKEAGVHAVVAATKESLEAEHHANLESTKQLLDTELNAKYEVDYANKLAEAKQSFTDELERKVSMIEESGKRLEEMESALNVSRSFTDGSVKAHRLGAAALALAGKLETSKSAKEEFGALSSVSEENTVIASAVKSIPSSIATGIPTLSELQTKFDGVYDKSRQAALVPSGRTGLEGQLMGIAIKTLKYAPSPDDPAPEESKDEPEYVLARAQRYVKLGELDRAVEQLSKLQGQAAFTVKDWKKSAEERIAADKALQVIKMEVALMNESLSKGGQ